MACSPGTLSHLITIGEQVVRKYKRFHTPRPNIINSPRDTVNILYHLAKLRQSILQHF